MFYDSVEDEDMSFWFDSEESDVVDIVVVFFPYGSNPCEYGGLLLVIK